MYSLEQLNGIVTQMLKKLEAIDEAIKGLPTAYASKLQWKQLDNIRNSDIEDLKRQMTDLQERLDLLVQQQS